MDMIKITGLWKSKDKNGNTYLSGSLNNITQLMVMSNTYKTDPKQPDYFLYLKPCQKKEEIPPPKTLFKDDDVMF